jgi:hypothetical protein
MAGSTTRSRLRLLELKMVAQAHSEAVVQVLGEWEAELAQP